MILYRISNHPDLSGRGAELATARWHTRAPGKRMVYLADHPALSVLEMMAQTDPGVDFPVTFYLLSVDIPARLVETLDLTELSSSWPENARLTEKLGDEWLRSRRSLALLVPTVLVPFAHNCLLNPLATGAEDLTLNQLGRFPLYPRIRTVQKT